MELCFLSRQSEKEQVVPADGAGPDTAICLRSARKCISRLRLWYSELFCGNTRRSKRSKNTEVVCRATFLSKFNIRNSHQ